LRRYPTVAPSRPRLVDHADGTYTMTYVTTVAAIHLVDITLVGENVGVSPKTPLSVQSITAAGDVALHLTEATGAGVASTVANAPSTFVITAVDINGIRVQTGGLKFVAGPARTRTTFANPRVLG